MNCRKKQPLRMIRKQTYLFPEQEKKLKELAKLKKVTEAEIIREALEHFLKEEEKGLIENPLFKIIGISGSAAGPEDGSVHHDKYLYDGS